MEVTVIHSLFTRGQMRFTMNKLLSCCFNMDTSRVEARFADGSAVAIDCVAVEDEYGSTPTQRAELDWLPFLAGGAPGL